MISQKLFEDLTQYHNESTNTETIEIDLCWEYIDMIYDQVLEKYQMADGFDIRTALSIFTTEQVERVLNESKESKSTT